MLKSCIINSIKLQIRNYASKPDARQTELMARSLPKKKPLPGVEDIVIVASGKGGVGKSTSAVNIAVTLARMGKRVGLLDADIFGPSVPRMMAISDEPLINDQNLMIPPVNYGVKCLSMGLLVNQGPVVWRGPLVMSALQRLLLGAVWGPLDILIVDTPPGTGDIHLSLAQNVPISGIILVSTPQIAALDVTRRGAEMYKSLGAPLIGLIENMSHTNCPNCQTQIKLFDNVTEKFADELKIKILETLPIDGSVSHASDVGQPFAIKSPDSEYAKRYRSIADQLLQFLDERKTKSV